MLSFRRRPLTWLFLIATACIDAIAIAGAANHESEWFGAAALGQMWAAGGWLATGTAHRLLRATVFLMTPIILSIPDYLHPLPGGAFTSPIVWPHVLGISLYLTDVAAAMTMLLIGLNGLMRRRTHQEGSSKWQFPLAEPFGWTIIVALLCVTMQAARFEFIDRRIVLDSLMIVALPVGLMALFLGDHVKTRLLTVTAIGGLIVSAIPVLSRVGSAEWLTVIVAYAYVGLWILVQRMDGARLARIPTMPSQHLT